MKKKSARYMNNLGLKSKDTVTFKDFIYSLVSDIHTGKENQIDSITKNLNLTTHGGKSMYPNEVQSLLRDELEKADIKDVYIDVNAHNNTVPTYEYNITIGLAHLKYGLDKSKYAYTPIFSNIIEGRIEPLAIFEKNKLEMPLSIITDQLKDLNLSDSDVIQELETIVIALTDLEYKVNIFSESKGFLKINMDLLTDKTTNIRIEW